MKQDYLLNFIHKAKLIHNNKYDYKYINYINAKTKIKILCNKHGIFEQRPDSHLSGSGCPICSKNRKLHLLDFIIRASFKHNFKYNYFLTCYVNYDIKVDIICPTHGIFKQSPSSHLYGAGCPLCNKGVVSNVLEFSNQATFKHNFKYDYFLVNYINNRTKVDIICPKHGIFKQTPSSHLQGSGCPSCGFVNMSLNKNYNLIYNKIKATFMSKYKVSNPMFVPEIRSKHKKIVGSNIINLKRFTTKLNNNSFNTSNQEIEVYDVLLEHFEKDDIVKNYKSSFYPFFCDFYIKSRNLYIELNIHWTHGGHWYNKSYDQYIVEKWSNKSLFYNNALQTFTHRDVLKRKYAKLYNLNYLVFWKTNLSDFYEWVSCGKPDTIDWVYEYSWKY